MRSKFCIVTMLGILCAYTTIAQITSASNGLTNVSGNVRLGGTLSANTTISLGTNNLNLTGTGRLGIGNSSPQAPLHVSGKVLIEANDDGIMTFNNTDNSW